MELVDTCFNFTSNAFRKDETELVKRAQQAGVNCFIITGSSTQKSEYALQLSKQYAGMYSTVGVHPHSAKEWTNETLDQLRTLAAHKNVVAIGEAGLDYNRNYSDHIDQKRAFQSQLELAVELKMPVLLHERDAHEEFVQILSQFRDQLTKVVVHCFTGTEAQLHRYIDLDCHIGITGWICDERRGQHLHKIIKHIPNNRLMIETDAPYLLPKDLLSGALVPKPKGRRNEPAYLPYILSAVTKYREASVEQTAQETTRTAKDFFQLYESCPRKIPSKYSD